MKNIKNKFEQLKNETNNKKIGKIRRKEKYENIHKRLQHR